MIDEGVCCGWKVDGGEVVGWLGMSRGWSCLLLDCGEAAGDCGAAGGLCEGNAQLHFHSSFRGCLDM